MRSASLVRTAATASAGRGPGARLDLPAFERLHPGALGARRVGRGRRERFAGFLQLADRGYVLENGRIVLADTGANLLANDEVRKAYLGG